MVHLEVQTGWSTTGGSKLVVQNWWSKSRKLKEHKTYNVDSKTAETESDFDISITSVQIVKMIIIVNGMGSRWLWIRQWGIIYKEKYK